jgi:hypothetical protein
MRCCLNEGSYLVVDRVGEPVGVSSMKCYLNEGSYAQKQVETEQAALLNEVLPQRR